VEALRADFYFLGDKTVIVGHFYTKMFNNLAFMMQNNAFLCVSADTKTWATCPIRAVLR
jgi:hypothetical protein